MELVSGRVIQGCSNAGNPFHECTPICLEKLNSVDVYKKEKKLFGFGKRTPSRDTPPGTPARGSRSPLPSFFTKKKVDSNASSSTDHTNDNFFSRLSPLNGFPSQPKNEAATSVDSLPMSPTLAGYSGGDFFARRRGGEDEDMYSPRPFGTRPKTPEHPLRTPQHRPRTPQHLSDTRPKTPIHESSAIGRRPQTPETRPQTAQHRGRSTEFMARAPGPRSKTPEPQPTYFEPSSRTPKQRSKTPEPSTRVPPQTQPISHRSLDSAAIQIPQTVETRPRTPEHRTRTAETRQRKHESRPKSAIHRGRSPDHHRETISQNQQRSFEMGERSPQAYNYIGSKAEAENDTGSVLLFPELILSPQEKPPITPSRKGYETPTNKEIRFDPLDESASSDDDKFSFVDDDDHDDKQDKEPPPELPDESQSFSLSEISRTKGILIIKKSDEIQSIVSESIVSVGDYKVRASVSATLYQILNKHGDIASGSKLHSLATRSYYLEMLASVVYELQTTPLRHLEESRVVEMLAIVRDVESVRIKAGWLTRVLEEIVEAVKHHDKHRKRGMEKEVWEGEVLRVRQEMEREVKELKEKEKGLKEWRERTTEMAGKVGGIYMRRARLDKRLGLLTSKVDKFQGQSVLQAIF
ncbi:Phospholipase-like protein [Hirschfeldia incana]|nr:Phospholipase-like protein [Hirschfeldia incana]